MFKTKKFLYGPGTCATNLQSGEYLFQKWGIRSLVPDRDWTKRHKQRSWPKYIFIRITLHSSASTWQKPIKPDLVIHVPTTPAIGITLLFKIITLIYLRVNHLARELYSITPSPMTSVFPEGNLKRSLYSGSWSKPSTWSKISCTGDHLMMTNNIQQDVPILYIYFTHLNVQRNLNKEYWYWLIEF